MTRVHPPFLGLGFTLGVTDPPFVRFSGATDPRDPPFAQFGVTFGSLIPPFLRLFWVTWVSDPLFSLVWGHLLGQ